MRRFASASFLALALTLATAPAFAVEPGAKPVVVVDVQGDLDAQAVRQAVASELDVDVVVPGDARASTATRTLEARADGAAKRLTVSMRTTSAPVTRTVNLPDDTSAWPKTVRFLAGNLARDEAGDLLAQLEKPKPGPVAVAPPPPSSPVAAASAVDLDDAERIVRLRAFLERRADDEHSDQQRSALWALATGAAAIGAGSYFLATPNEPPTLSGSTPGAFAAYDVNDTRREVGLTLLGAGSGLVIVSGLLALGTTAHEELRDASRKELALESRPANERLEAFERRWKAAADESRVANKRSSVLSMILGSAIAGTAIAVQAAEGDEGSLAPAAAIATLGVAWTASGIFSYGQRTPVERSYLEYRALTYPAAPAPRPVLGLAPSRGGATAALTFRF